jgi:hypothetical protein
VCADVAPVEGLRYVIGDEGRNGSGEKKRARWSFGEAEIVWWKACDTLCARRSSRCGRLMRICSRSSGRSKVRIAAVGSRRSDMFMNDLEEVVRLLNRTTACDSRVRLVPLLGFSSVSEQGEDASRP